MTQSRLSTRISLRWPPEPAFENTDTLVLSVADWYVDLRVDRESTTIDWAIAGQRLVEGQNDPGKEEDKKVLFTHELDSHNAFEAVDCGTFVPLPNGDELETGSMPRVDLPGAPESEYEEVWRKLPFRPQDDVTRRVSWILEGRGGAGDGEWSEAGEKEVTRTFVGVIWGTYIVLRQRQVLLTRKGEEAGVVVKSGGEVSARREDFIPGKGFEVKYSLGPMADLLPARKDFDGIVGSPGATVMVAGEKYVIRAFEDLGGN